MHWVRSAWFDVNFARGLLCCDLFYRGLRGLSFTDFYMVVKFADMDADWVFCIETNLARGYLYWITSHRYRDISCYMFLQTFMLWEILQTFLRCLEACAKYFDWLVRLCWVYL